MASCDVVCFRVGETPVELDLGLELDRLYGGRYASLPHFEIYHSNADLLVYVARDDEQVVSALLFQIDRHRVTVGNEGIPLTMAETEQFASYVFRQFPAVSAVSFRCVEIADGPCSFPHQRTAADTDMIVPLPATVDEYRMRISSSTRGTLNNQLNKFKRDFSGFRLDVFEREAVPPELVRGIIALQRGRMEDVGKLSMVNDDEEQRVLAYVARCGFVVAISVDGKLVAGTINYRHGRNFTARIVGHDPAFMNYSIGFLSAYLTICECIKTGAAGRFYFGWGHGDYKYRLGGVDRQLSHHTLYRSRAHMLGHAGFALRDEYRGQLCRARRWAISTAARQDNLAGKALKRVRAAMTRMRVLTARRAAPPAAGAGAKRIKQRAQP